MTEKQKKINQTLQALTLEEKAWLISGGGDFWHTRAIPAQGIPSLTLHDGPHGLRMQASETDNAGLNESLPATAYPSLSTTACSFDPDLVFEMGQALGAEANAASVDVLLAPGVNIKRHPLCGRNFEYFSEDPLLAGELASAYVSGVQSQGVAASLKHFAANNQEFCRMVNSSVIDERALREIYLKPFEIAIRKAQPWTVMNSYNKINGVYACEQAELLTTIARNDWGFEGLFTTDWGGMDDRAIAIAAGTDLEMPPLGKFGADRVVEAVRSGQLAESDVDRAVRKLLELADKVRNSAKSVSVWQVDAFDAVAKKVAVESAVLLKNEQNMLPLSDGMKVAVIGELAEKPHYQGAGSSRVNPRQLVPFLSAMRSENLDWAYTCGYHLGAKRDAQLEQEALQRVKGMDVVLFFAGLTDTTEAESYDRQNMDLPEAQNALIDQIASENPNVVVVLHCGSPVRMPWLGKVKAVLLMGLGGQMLGEATLELLLGRSNPCGKLAETWPLSLEDTPAHGHFGQRFNTEYRESVFVGYRFYESFAKPVCFPFGFGLSYTSFALEGVQISENKLAPGGSVEVRVKVSNTGTRPGKEVLQLYVAPPGSAVFRPQKELKAFKKVALNPGESQVVSFVLRHSDFAFWNAQIHDWHCEAGEYRLLIGTSAADTPQEARVALLSDKPDAGIPDFTASAPAYYAYGSGGLEVSDGAYAAVLSRPLPQDPQGKAEPYDLNTTLWDVRDKPMGKLIAGIVRKNSRKLVTGEGESREVNQLIMEASIMDAPLRFYAVGDVPMKFPEAIVLLLNGKVLKGLRKLMEKEKP